MDKRYRADGNINEETIGLMTMNAVNLNEDPVLFTIDEAEWGDIPSLPSPQPRRFDWHGNQNQSSLSEISSLSSYTNAGFQDYQRQQSNLHSPFDSDTVFLFSNSNPRKRKVNIRKKLAAVWCTACVFRLWQFLCSCPFDCTCRDQTGVHCMYKLKQKVVRKLKVVQGILCLLSIIQSGMVFLPLGAITSDFDGHCLLYSNLIIQRVTKNDTVTLDVARSKFGSKEDCDFTTYINVVVAVVGLFFIWFFIHTSYVSGLEHSEVKLQLPFLLCYLTLLVSVIISSFKITIGFNSWCHNIIVNNPLKIKTGRIYCKDFESLKWSTESRSNFYTNSVVAEVSSWLLTLTLVLQLSVNALQLYQNFKAAYEEIEVPHAKLDESGEFSGEEDTNWDSGDPLLMEERAVPQLPVYKVEYKKHQVLAKVVIHRDRSSLYEKFDPKSTFVLDKLKFRKHISGMDGFGLMARRKIDFPLKMEPGRRKRLNWTGSCEELHSKSDLQDKIGKQLTLCSHEWHGFDTNITGFSEIVDWQADFGSKIQKVWASHSFEWPGAKFDSANKLSNQSVSFEWHGFENDFVSQHKKSSSSLPGDWQISDTNYLPRDWQKFDEINSPGQFEWANEDVQRDGSATDPWTSGELHHQLSEDSNDSSTKKTKDLQNRRKNYKNSNQMNISGENLGQFEGDKR